VLRGLGNPGLDAVRTVFSDWDALVGPEVAAHARPVSLDGHCLLVIVDEPGWATRFRYEHAGLIQRFSAELGEGVVTRIDVRVRTANEGKK
jgi:predicted nucleic acid-binding Zn ribbon protein